MNNYVAQAQAVQQQLANLGIDTTYAANIVQYLQTHDVSVGQIRQLYAKAEQAKALVRGKDINNLDSATKNEVESLISSAYDSLGVNVSVDKDYKGETNVVIKSPTGETIAVLDSENINTLTNETEENDLKSTFQTAANFSESVKNNDEFIPVRGEFNNTGTNSNIIIFLGVSILVVSILTAFLSRLKGKNKRLKKSIAIFLIPIIMFLCGSMMLTTVGWKLSTSKLNIVSSIFSSTDDKSFQKNFKVNDLNMKRPAIGENFAVLDIPKIRVSAKVYNGDSDKELINGVGHFSGSTIPGEKGNVILSAHRDTFFKNLENIKSGDEVFVQTDYGKFVYRVESTVVVDKKDTKLLNVSNKEKLTIYTCYPFDFVGQTDKRFVVNCKFEKVM